MPISPLLPAVDKPRRRSLWAPLMVIAALGAAFFLEVRWIRSSAAASISVFRQTTDGWQRLPTPGGLPGPLQVSNGGTVWTITVDRSGVSRWDGSAWQFYSGKDWGDQSVAVPLGLALDGEQVWVPTRHGVAHWDGQRWRLFREVKVSYDASIAAGNGESWLLNPDGTLSHFANGHWQTQKLALPGVDWTSKGDYPQLDRTNDGALWLMWQGLWRWDGAKWSRLAAAAKESSGVDMMQATGDRVWIFDGKELRSVSEDGKQWTSYTREHIGLGKDDAVTSVTSSRGRAWFTSTGGALEFDGVGWRKFPPPGAGQGFIRNIAVGPDGTLWMTGSASRSARTLRQLIYVTALFPLALLAAFGWFLWRFRTRQRDENRRVVQAVEHATGEIPDELEAAARKSHPILDIAFLSVGTLVGYILLRLIWHKAPYWTVLLIGLSIHLLTTFRQSLVKRKPKPSDPIGPGAPSRYNWTKTWQAMSGAVALVLLVNLDRIPILRFLRGYWFWIFLLAPAAYQGLAMYLLNRAVKRGDYDGALKISRWTHFYNPWSMEPLRSSGFVLLMAGRYRKAEDALRRSLASSQINETYGLALERLGDALAEQGRYDEAMRSYEAALHALPWQHRPYRGMAETVLRRGGDPQMALDYVEKILDYSSVSWWQRKANGNARDDYWALKAWALARLGGGSEVPVAIENAFRHTNKRSAPDMASAHYRVGMALQALGEENEAKEHFRLAVQFDPHGRRGTLANTVLRETSIWGAVKV